MSTTTNNCVSEGVSLMTMHAAKGLEFNKVILPFWVDGNVPYIRQHNYNPSDERRLAFVSLTRAREKVIITFSKFTSSNSKQTLKTENEPSLYIEELFNNQNSELSINFEDLCSYNNDAIKSGRIDFINYQSIYRKIDCSKLDRRIPMDFAKRFCQTLNDTTEDDNFCAKNGTLMTSAVRWNRDTTVLQRDVSRESIISLSDTVNEIDDINYIFLKSIDELTIDDIKRLMSNKLVKKKSTKKYSSRRSLDLLSSPHGRGQLF